MLAQIELELQWDFKKKENSNVGFKCLKGNLWPQNSHAT